MKALFLFLVFISISASAQTTNNKSTSEDKKSVSKDKPNATGFVEFNKGKLYYEIKGEGCPLVLISGGGGMDLRQWDAQFKSLKKKFRVIRYDVRGVGRSDTPSVSYSNAADLKAILDFLEIEKAVLAGVSLGGGIALDFALTYPERVFGLVLSGPLVRGFQVSDELKKRVEKFAQADQALEAKRISVDEAIKVFLDDAYFVPAPDNPKARRIAKQLMRDNVRNIPPGLEQQLDPPTVTRIAEIKHPTLLLIGNLDHPDLHRRVDFLRDTIKDAKKVIIEGGGHILNLEKPKQFSQAVSDFLQKNICSF